MFLQLAQEYTDALNSKETPTVLTAIDRVIQAEAIKIQDDKLEQFREHLDQVLNEDEMPITQKEFEKIVKKSLRTFKRDLELDLAKVLNF